jgi:hypothetical protein
VANSNENIDRLSALYKIITPQDLLGNYKLEKFTDPSTVDKNVLGQILKIFVNTTDSSGASGLLSFSEIKKMLNDLDNDGSITKKYINLYEDTKYREMFEDPEILDAKPSLYVISLNAPTLNLSLRDVNKTGVFLNAVPSLEMSRCVPMLDVKFELAFPGESGDNVDADDFAARLSSRSPTLLRYLNGSDKNYGSSDKTMARGSLHPVNLSSRANSSSDQQAWKNSSVVVSGMELFTSPQTLVSPDSVLHDGSRTVPVLDPFSAFMSIDSFEITAAPSGGSMSYKTARLSLVLHDRSRLHEIAALIKPDAYSRTTVSISYGWSHPDKSNDSPIADLINQMVVHDEKYNIVNSSFSFGQGGGVKITLQLAVKGASELSVIRIADGKDYVEKQRLLEELSQIIREAREVVPGLKQPDAPIKDVRVYQIIDSAANNSELIEGFDINKDIDKLRKFVNELQKSNKNKNNSEIFKNLKDTTSKIEEWLRNKSSSSSGIDPKQKEETRSANLNNMLGQNFIKLVGKSKDGYKGAPDPFLTEDALYWEEPHKSEIAKIKDGSSDKPRQFVSLAKLLMFYVGKPLQSLGNQLADEVQFVYYPLNSEAGTAKGTNLAAFPVDIQYFREVMAEHARRTNNSNITIRQFVELLNSAILSDVRSFAYGLRSLYKERPVGKPSEAPTLKNSGGAIPSSIATFRKPVVEVQIESRGGRPLRNGEIREDKGQMRILRIHVYDKLSSAYEPTLKVLEAQQGLQNVDPKDPQQFNSVLNNVANMMGIKSFTNGVFTNYDDLKRVISQVTPVLNYGANNSGIIAASLQTMQNSDLATVNMQRSMGPQYNSEPNGSGVSALPLRVQPSQLDLTLIGCPLLNLTQQFFIDFNTGTTVDDLYVLTHLSHRIAAGKFESTAKFTPLNAYGSYENIASKIRKIQATLEKIQNNK